eukprot:scaffold843_cov255-Pinguiococcus_pyrenoidosus.AAC.14
MRLSLSVVHCVSSQRDGSISSPLRVSALLRLSAPCCSPARRSGIPVGVARRFVADASSRSQDVSTPGRPLDSQRVQALCRDSCCTLQNMRPCAQTAENAVKVAEAGAVPALIAVLAWRSEDGKREDLETTTLGAACGILASLSHYPAIVGESSRRNHCAHALTLPSDAASPPVGSSLAQRAGSDFCQSRRL